MAYRISNEGGREAASRNFGRLAMFAIPLVLALGASAWLSFYLGARSARREAAQEARSAVAVGITSSLVAPMKVTIRSQEFCAPVTRAEIDGRSLRLYATNDCAKQLSGMDWRYQLVSPNGTVLHESWKTQRENGCTSPRFRGDAAECVIDNVPVEPRTAEIRVWTVPYSDK